MPTVPTAPPADRFYARLIKFELACPSCGHLFASDDEEGVRVVGSMVKKGRQLARKQGRSVKQAHQLVWNPLTQRLRCPRCRGHFVVGLLAFPSPGGGRHAPEAPPDAIQTIAERRQLRAAGGGWVAEAPYLGQAVNHYVPAGCSCPPKGWAASCPVHASQAGPDPA